MEQIEFTVEQKIRKLNNKVLEFTETLLTIINEFKKPKGYTEINSDEEIYEDEKLNEYKEYFEKCEIDNLEEEDLFDVNIYCRNILVEIRNLYSESKDDEQYNVITELIDNFFNEAKEESINHLKNIRINVKEEYYSKKYLTYNIDLYSDNLEDCLKSYGYYYNYLNDNSYNQYLIETCLEMIFNFKEYYEEYYEDYSDYKDFANGVEKQKGIYNCIEYLNEFKSVINNNVDIYGNKGYLGKCDEYALNNCLVIYAKYYDSISVEEKNKIEECIKKIFNLTKSIMDIDIFKKELAICTINNKVNNLISDFVETKEIYYGYNKIKKIEYFNKNKKIQFNYKKYGFCYNDIGDKDKKNIEDLLKTHFNIKNVTDNEEFKKGQQESIKNYINNLKNSLKNVQLKDQNISINLLQHNCINYKLYGYYFNNIDNEDKEIISVIENYEKQENREADIQKGKDIREFFDGLKQDNEELYLKLVDPQKPTDQDLFLEKYGFYYNNIDDNYKNKIDEFLKNCILSKYNQNVLYNTNFKIGENNRKKSDCISFLKNIKLKNEKIVSLIGSKIDDTLKLYGYYYNDIKEEDKKNIENLIVEYHGYNREYLRVNKITTYKRFIKGSQNRIKDDTFCQLTNIKLKQGDNIGLLNNNDNEKEYCKNYLEKNNGHYYKKHGRSGKYYYECIDKNVYKKEKKEIKKQFYQEQLEYCLKRYGYYYEQIDESNYNNIENLIKKFFNLDKNFNIANNYMFKTGKAKYEMEKAECYLKKSIKLNNGKTICLLNNSLNNEFNKFECLEMYGYNYDYINDEDKQQIEEALKTLVSEDINENDDFKKGRETRKQKNDSLNYLKHILINNNEINFINEENENDLEYCLKQYGYYYEDIISYNRQQIIEKSIKIFFNLNIDVTTKQDFKDGMNKKLNEEYIKYLKNVPIESYEENISLINEKNENDLEYCLKQYRRYYSKINYDDKKIVENTIKKLFNLKQDINITETKEFKEEKEQHTQLVKQKREFIKNFNEYILQFSSDKQIKLVSTKKEIEEIIKICGKNSKIFEEKLSENNTNINNIFDNFEMYFNKKGINKIDLENIYSLEKEKNIFNININNIMYDETNSLLSISNNELFQFICNLGCLQCDLSNIQGNVNNELLSGQEYIFKGSEKFYGCDYEQLKSSYISGFLHLFNNVPIVQNQQKISRNIVGDNLNYKNCLFQFIYYENNIESNFKEKLKNGFKNIFNIDVDSEEIRNWYQQELNKQNKMLGEMCSEFNKDKPLQK